MSLSIFKSSLVASKALFMLDAYILKATDEMAEKEGLTAEELAARVRRVSDAADKVATYNNTLTRANVVLMFDVLFSVIDDGAFDAEMQSNITLELSVWTLEGFKTRPEMTPARAAIDAFQNLLIASRDSDDRQYRNVLISSAMSFASDLLKLKG